MSTRLERRVIDKVAAYTIKFPMDSPGTLFTNRGATGSVTFTLPAPGRNTKGHWYEFRAQADQSIVVAAATAGDLMAPGNVAADNVGFQVASYKTGRGLLVLCDGTKWYAYPVGARDGFCVNGTEASPSGAELQVLASVVAGAAQASKAVVLDANKAVDSNFLLKLGAAVTVQSPPAAMLPADVTGAASGTTQSTFYTLSSVAIPANALSANGKGFFFMFGGTTAANANAKDFRLSYGAATVTLVVGNTGNAVPFVCCGVVYRTSAGAQRVIAELIVGTASPIPIDTTTAADETTAWTFALQSQNTAAAAASATGHFGQVTFQN